VRTAARNGEVLKVEMLKVGLQAALQPSSTPFRRSKLEKVRAEAFYLRFSQRVQYSFCRPKCNNNHSTSAGMQPAASVGSWLSTNGAEH
jgi:hypothetical protein